MEVLLLVAVGPFLLGIALVSILAHPLTSLGRGLLLLAIVPVLVGAFYVLAPLHVFGYDQKCTEECWGNLWLGGGLIAVGAGAVFAAFVALVQELRDEQRRGNRWP